MCIRDRGVFGAVLSYFDWFWCMEQMQKRLITVNLYQTIRYYIHNQESVYNIRQFRILCGTMIYKPIRRYHSRCTRAWVTVGTSQVLTRTTTPNLSLMTENVVSTRLRCNFLDHKLDSTRYIWACRSDRFAYFESLFMLSQEEPTFGQDRCNS